MKTRSQLYGELSFITDPVARAAAVDQAEKAGACVPDHAPAATANGVTPLVKSMREGFNAANTRVQSISRTTSESIAKSRLTGNEGKDATQLEIAALRVEFSEYIQKSEARAEALQEAFLRLAESVEVVDSHVVGVSGQTAAGITSLTEAVAKGRGPNGPKTQRPAGAADASPHEDGSGGNLEQERGGGNGGGQKTGKELVREERETFMKSYNAERAKAMETNNTSRLQALGTAYSHYSSWMPVRQIATQFQIPMPAPATAATA